MIQVLAFLQNQWFRNPEKVQRMYEENPEHRNDYIRHFLFMGCLTGRRLEQALGEPLCQRIIWEEASPEVGGYASSVFAPDLDHMRKAVEKFSPDIVIAFGKVAAAVGKLDLPCEVFFAP